MLRIEIPGNKTISADHLVLDYNGTLAIEGTIIEGIKEKLNLLADKIKIHVVTADTFGQATANLKDIHCQCTIL